MWGAPRAKSGVTRGDKSAAFQHVHDRNLEPPLQVWAELPESIKDALLVMVSDRSRQWQNTDTGTLIKIL